MSDGATIQGYTAYQRTQRALALYIQHAAELRGGQSAQRACIYTKSKQSK